MPTPTLERRLAAVHTHFSPNVAQELSGLLISSEEVRTAKGLVSVCNGAQAETFLNSLQNAQRGIQSQGLAVLLQLYEIVKGPDASRIIAKLPETHQTRLHEQTNEIEQLWIQSWQRVKQDYQGGKTSASELRALLLDISRVPLKPFDQVFRYDLFDEAVDCVFGFTADDRTCWGKVDELMDEESISYVSSPVRHALAVSRLLQKHGIERVVDIGCGRFRFGALLHFFSGLPVLGYDYDPCFVSVAKERVNKLGFSGCSVQEKDLLKEPLDLKLGDAVYLYTPFYGSGQDKFIERFKESDKGFGTLVVAYDAINLAFRRAPFIVVDEQDFETLLGTYRIPSAFRPARFTA